MTRTAGAAPASDCDSDRHCPQAGGLGRRPQYSKSGNRPRVTRSGRRCRDRGLSVAAGMSGRRLA